MRRRLFLFHTVTLIGALAILLTVNGMVVHGVSDFYQRRSVPAADGDSQQVQAILEAWTATQNWEALELELSAFDYGLVVSQGDNVIFSSLDRMQERMYRGIASSASWPEEGTMVVQNEGAVMVGRQAGDYTLVAVPQPDVPPVLGQQRPREEAVMLAMVASGLVAIGIIALFSLAFSRYQIRQIMRPVNALTAAARRVEEGDLSTPVGYGGQDEFSSVCAAFDHMQRHLLRERERNASYEQARTALVAGISHDLRTPLTSVKGYIKGLRDGVAQTPEKQAQYLDIAYRKACDMDVLLQRLFYFSKLETGNLPLFPENTDLGEFITKFAAGVRGELASRGGDIQVQAPEGPYPVRIDTEQMYRVLSNLTENALRYANAHPLVLTLTLSLQPGQICLRFADNGQGVPQEQLPDLFDQFWRGDQARRSQGGEGSGLGLYIVKYIVEAHGGTIRASNDQGLVFDLTLPRREGSE